MNNACSSNYACYTFPVPAGDEYIGCIVALFLDAFVYYIMYPFHNRKRGGERGEREGESGGEGRERGRGEEKKGGRERQRKERREEE